MSRRTVRVFNSSSDKLADVNPANIELLDEYMDYYESDHSDKSVTVVRSNLNIFFVWVKDNLDNKDFVDIKKRDLLKYQNFLSKQGLSPARIRALRSAVSSLSNFIEDILDEDEKWADFRPIMNKIKAPQLVAVRDKTILEDSFVEAYLEKLITAGKYTHACTLALAWASGRRKAELLEFKVSFFKEEHLKFGCLYESPKEIKTKGNGKLGKRLTVYVFKPKFEKYFNLYMEWRRENNIPDTVDELFVRIGKNGEVEPLKESTLASFSNKFKKEMDVCFYWHCMRHQLVTSLLRAGIPAEVVQDLLGWNSIDMVSIYSDIPKSDGFSKFFGEDGIQKVEKKSLTDL